MPSQPEPRRGPSTPRFIGAVNDQWQMFSDSPEDYSIGLPIGFGASSVVYLSRYIPADGSSSIPCAIKVVDLDKLPQLSLRLLRRETQLMSLSKHPNVLRVRGSWMAGHNLYIALRLMNSGSAADVMRYGWPGGMDEEVVKCILKQALEGLNYLHVNGFIHRDVKAANLLIDDDGTVLLGDLGVSASLSDDEAAPPRGPRSIMNLDGHGQDNDKHTGTSKRERLGKRKSFVGTIISGKQYDAKADIWSFGITAIELTQGRAPRCRETPARVLLKTVQDEPPNFARENGQHKFTRAFKEIVEKCLAKDPSLRPSAAELLETPFFKYAKKKSYLMGTILKDLPPLTSRQERRLNPHAPQSLTRSSMSSWDFSVDLHHSIVTTHDLMRPWLNSLEAASSATANSITRHRQQNSPSPGYSHLSRPVGVEDVGKSDWPQTDYHNIHDKLRNVDGEKGPEPPSPRSFVFELSDNESSDVVHESGFRQDSSAATTPLSCSPEVTPAVNSSGTEGKLDEAKLVVESPRRPSTAKGNDTMSPNRRPRRLSMPVHNWMKRDTIEPRELSQCHAPTAELHRGLVPASVHKRLSFSQFTKPSSKNSEKSSGLSSGTSMSVASSGISSSPAKDSGYSYSATTQTSLQAQNTTAANKGLSRWRMLVRSFNPGGGDRSEEPEQRRNPIYRFLERNENEVRPSS